MQNLSIIASKGFETKFKEVIEHIAANILPREADQTTSINHLLILKEHAILIIGNLVFDSEELLRVTLLEKYQILQKVISLVHFKRT